MRVCSFGDLRREMIAPSAPSCWIFTCIYAEAKVSPNSRVACTVYTTPDYCCLDIIWSSPSRVEEALLLDLHVREFSI